MLPPELELPEGEEPYKSNLLWEILAKVPEYHLLFSRAARRTRHINVAESGAVLHAEKLLGKALGSWRELFGIDSQVSLGV